MVGPVTKKFPSRVQSSGEKFEKKFTKIRNEKIKKPL